MVDRAEIYSSLIVEYLVKRDDDEFKDLAPGSATLQDALETGELKNISGHAKEGKAKMESNKSQCNHIRNMQPRVEELEEKDHWSPKWDSGIIKFGSVRFRAARRRGMFDTKLIVTYRFRIFRRRAQVEHV